MRIASLLALGLAFSTQISAAPVKFAKSSGTITWTGAKEYDKDDKHYGTVDLKGGELDIAAKKGEFVIDMKTIAPQDGDDAKSKKKLAGHLSSDDFFAVDKYPEAKIIIKDLAPEKAGSDVYTVTADVTIRDKTQELKFPATVTQKDGKTDIQSSFDIDRTKFGVSYSAPSDSLGSKISKDVKNKLIKKDVKIDLKLQSV